MILIFTSAALKSPYPLEMLANVANPEYVSVLLKMLVNASPMNKLTIISIIKNLIRVNVPFEIFEKSLHDIECELPAFVQFDNKLAQFFYNLALQIRTGKWNSLYLET
jgi:hypothetical protein